MSKSTVLELLKQCAQEVNEVGVTSPEYTAPIYEKYELLILRIIEKAVINRPES